MPLRRFGDALVPLVALVALHSLSAHAAAAPSADGRKPPRPGPDFPALESYYPAAAKRAGEEGAAIIHFCVDPRGKLTEPPTVSGSSGNLALDNAAVTLANAGDGHYLPGSENGVAIGSCSLFKIKFELRGDTSLLSDARLPTITARIIGLAKEYGHRASDVAGKAGFMGQPPLLVPGNPESARMIRQYARGFDAMLDDMTSMFADFLDDVEYLEKSPDIPETERAIFHETWPNERAGVALQFRQMLNAARDVVRSMDEMADYVTFSTSRHASAEGPAESQAPAEDPQFNAIRERALNALKRMQASIGALSKEPPGETNGAR